MNLASCQNLNTSIDSADEPNNLRYPGQYFDAETNLHYNWNRYYSSELGRYLAKDPVGFMGGVNVYAYAQSNPQTLSDALGLFTDRKGLEKLLGSCKFYDELFKNYKELNGCDSMSNEDYFIGYGKKYCERFNNWTYWKLSEEGQAWIKKTTKSLQRALLNIEDINNLSPKKIAEIAFESHVDAYWKSGLGDLPLSDMVYVGLTPDPSELKGPYAEETLDQAGRIYEKIRTSDTYDRLADEIVEYGGVPAIYDVISAGANRMLEVE